MAPGLVAADVPLMNRAGRHADRRPARQGGDCGRGQAALQASAADLPREGSRYHLPTALGLEPTSYYALAYCSALMTSMQTKRSLPSTQASWPGGIV